MKKIKLNPLNSKPIIGKKYYHKGVYQSKGIVTVVGEPQDTYFNNFNGTILHPGQSIKIKNDNGKITEVALKNLWEIESNA